MTKTVEDLRKDFTEFADDAAFPDGDIQFWLDIAYEDLSGTRFGSRLDLAAELFTAHMIVLGRRNRIAADGGKTPGQATGVVTSRSVDKVSVSYDASKLSEDGASFWNSTDYGMRFWWILRQRCLGPVYRSAYWPRRYV